MMKKYTFLIIAAALFLALAIVFWPQQNTKNHPFLDAQSKGDSRSLKGNVVVALIFADEPDSSWSENNKRNYLFKLMSETNSLKTEAEKYGTALDISLVSFTCKTSVNLSMTDYSSWLNEAMSSVGFSSSNAVDYLKNKYDKDEAAVVFVIKGSGRPFSLPSTENTGFECSFIYSDDAGFRHELLHLFGAKDLYYPQSVKALAEESFSESVMFLSKNKTVDSLTAYLVGWAPADEEATAFFERTKKISQKEIDNGRKDELFTGYGEKSFYNGIYKGELLNGMAHGQGTLTFNNGDVYTGAFSKNEIDGNGTYIWKNGDTYSGEFSMGKREGQGIRNFINGNVYTGTFVDGKMMGEGTLTLNDGTLYSGNSDWEKITGSGTVTYPDGSKYSGDFAKGKRSGNGTLTLPDGSVFSGEFENDKKISGTFTTTDGTSYSGKFFSDHIEMLNGFGTITYPDGTHYDGAFENGLKKGSGTVTLPNGTTYSGNF